MADSHDTEMQQRPPLLASPSPSTPLHLTGFLANNTIQVQGDAGNLEFSVQLNIHSKQNSDDYFPYPDVNVPEFHAYSNSKASSYMTPITTPQVEDAIRNGIGDENIPEKEDSCALINNYGIVTRLRSGVLSPVSSYRPPKSYAAIKSNRSSRSTRRRKGKVEGKRDVLEAVFRRRSFPVRPLNSYTLFMIAAWATVKCSSFQSTSKKLSRMWCKLPQDEKKVFEDMALRDNARYKRQLMLLKNHTHEYASN